MLKNEFFHNVNSNIGIAIDYENNTEIIFKLNIFYNKKINAFTLLDEYSVLTQNFGTIIADFQNTDFNNTNEFFNFYDKYCLFALENNKLLSLFKNQQCSVSSYDTFKERIFKKYKKVLISYQTDINSILDYCLFKPSKKTMTLTPFERLCILEYSPNNIDLLRDNLMQVVTLNTLTNIASENYTEDELINEIKNKNCIAYQDFIYIPNSISALLHFELQEILKYNIVLKQCAYCSKYFTSHTRHGIYCDNIAPGYENKTCNQIARNRRSVENKKHDEALTLYSKVYHNKAYKASRYKDITNYTIDYKHFQEIGKKKVQKYKSNKITKEEFIDWINRNK